MLWFNVRNIQHAVVLRYFQEEFSPVSFCAVTKTPCFGRFQAVNGYLIPSFSGKWLGLGTKNPFPCFHACPIPPRSCPSQERGQWEIAHIAKVRVDHLFSFGGQADIHIGDVGVLIKKFLSHKSTGAGMPSRSWSFFWATACRAQGNRSWKDSGNSADPSRRIT